MPWIATNLAGAMGDITAKANKAISDVQKGMDNLSKQVDSMNDKMNQAVSAISATKNFLAKMEASGLYMIQLAPGQGSWVSRLTSAAGAPPDLGYCFGTANIIITPDIGGAMDGFNKMKEGIAKPMQDAANLINKKDTDGFVPDEEPDELEEVEPEKQEEWDSLFPVNSWSATTINKIFGGATAGLSDSLGKSIKSTKSLQKSMGETQKVQFAVNKGLSSAKTLMAGLNATGVYNIILEPGPGNYISRLQSELNPPPTASNLYCSGFVAIAVAPDLASMAEKYATMSKLLLGA